MGDLREPRELAERSSSSLLERKFVSHSDHFLCFQADKRTDDVHTPRGGKTSEMNNSKLERSGNPPHPTSNRSTPSSI